MVLALLARAGGDESQDVLGFATSVVGVEGLEPPTSSL